MVLAAVDMGDGIMVEVQGLHYGWIVHNSIVITSALANTGTTEAVNAPRPDMIVHVNGERVVGAGVDSFVLFDFRAKRLRLECSFDTFRTSTLDDMISKLILLTRTPNEDRTFVVHSHGMVSTAADIDNVLETRVENWCVLDFDICIRKKTEDAVIFLLCVIVSPAARIR